MAAASGRRPAELEHRRGNLELLDERVEQASSCQPGPLLGPEADQQVVRVEVALGVEEDVEDVIAADLTVAELPGCSSCPSTVRSRSSACWVTLSVSDAIHASRPGRRGAMTLIASAASPSASALLVTRNDDYRSVGKSPRHLH